MIKKLREDVPFSNFVNDKKINEIIEWINKHEKNSPYIPPKKYA